MPFALVTAGLIMIITGATGCHKAFGNLLAGEFSGNKNFAYWLASIGAVGALGYVDALRTFSHVFMTLIIVVMLLSNQGFFAQLSQALSSGPKTVPGADTTASAPVAPLQITPSQGIASGAGGVGINWGAAITNMLPALLGG